MGTYKYLTPENMWVICHWVDEVIGDKSMTDKEKFKLIHDKLWALYHDMKKL